MAQLPPPQPTYVLRGHTAAIHALAFNHRSARARARGESWLVSGDADGWLVCWDLSYKRPLGVWKAHDGAILGLSFCGPHRLLSHGRDNRLVVWHVSSGHLARLSRALPVDGPDASSKPPVAAETAVNSMNFCAFAWCPDDRDGELSAAALANGEESELGPAHSFLLAVPTSKDSDGIDVLAWKGGFSRIATIETSTGTQVGLVMSLHIGVPAQSSLRVIGAFENGYTCIYHSTDNGSTWNTVYSAKAHRQPVLSLHLSPAADRYFTSSADSQLARHVIPSIGSTPLDTRPLQVVDTKHSGQQSLQVRSDGKIFATAGWDGKARVYSTKTMKELAVLKWHREGCQAVALAQVADDSTEGRYHPQTSDGVQLRLETEPPEVSEETVGEAGEQDCALAKRREVAVRQASPGSSTVSERRNRQAKQAHLLALGSKDCRISLWDVF